MFNFLDGANSDILIKLAVAVILGLVIGFERFWVHKEAGMKTHALVSMGAALFVLVAESLALKYGDLSAFHPGQVVGSIVTGIGFLGAGSIIFQGTRLKGLTTAGGLWVTAGIGMATGFGLYDLAIIATLLTLFVFVVITLVEAPLKKISGEGE